MARRVSCAYIPRMGPALNISGLTVMAPDGRCLLDIPDLTVAPGSALAITGPSGAGKTTLLDLCAGLTRPTAGHLRWGETDLAALPETARAAFRRRHIGLILQDSHLFDELGAGANASLAAAFAPRAERAGIKARAADALDRFGVPGQSPSASVLSGGERQRVAVARALASDPPILLADEPTAALDRATAERVADDLFAQCRDAGRTLLIVSHDPAIADRADRMIRLDAGRVAA